MKTYKFWWFHIDRHSKILQGCTTFDELEYRDLYNNVTSVCVFIGCWPWSIRWHTYRSWDTDLIGYDTRYLFVDRPLSVSNHLFINQSHHHEINHCQYQTRENQRRNQRSQMVFYRLQKILYPSPNKELGPGMKSTCPNHPCPHIYKMFNCPPHHNS